jgi:hypothetical protein
MLLVAGRRDGCWSCSVTTLINNTNHTCHKLAQMQDGIKNTACFGHREGSFHSVFLSVGVGAVELE